MEVRWHESVHCFCEGEKVEKEGKTTQPSFLLSTCMTNLLELFRINIQLFSFIQLVLLTCFSNSFSFFFWPAKLQSQCICQFENPTQPSCLWGCIIWVPPIVPYSSMAVYTFKHIPYLFSRNIGIKYQRGSYLIYLWK